MEDQKKTQLFEQTPIPRAVMSMSIPTIISSLVMVIYNLADTYFVGMLNDPIQNAAVTACDSGYSFYAAAAWAFRRRCGECGGDRRLYDMDSFMRCSSGDYQCSACLSCARRGRDASRKHRNDERLSS